MPPSKGIEVRGDPRPFKGENKQCFTMCSVFVREFVCIFFVLFDVLRGSGGSWTYSESFRNILEMFGFRYFLNIFGNLHFLNFWSLGALRDVYFSGC